MKFAYIIIHLSLLIILIGMIIYRYTPYDEKGYENYFKLFRKGNTASDGFASVVGLLMYLVIPLCVVFLKRDIWEQRNGTDIEKRNKAIIIFIALCCFIASITLVFNLMNIVMSFRTNTTPMLKTTCLGWSLQQSFNGHKEYKITDSNKATFVEDSTIQEANRIKTIETEYDNIKKLTDITDTTKGTKSLLEGCGANISSALDVLIAFEELTNVVINGLSTENKQHTTYVQQLKDIIKTNFTLLNTTKNDPYNQFTSEVSLIFDKKVNIPNYYGNPKDDDPILKTYPNFSSEHSVNSNDRNKDYVYTADISYGNANVFYEKYWDIDDTEGDFLWRYDYFVPTYLFGGGENRPNLLKILNYVAIFTVAIFIISCICYYYIKTDFLNAFLKSFEILTPLIALVVFLTFIIVFIRFNTNFNKNVVYKCLDCSYKRALNKLNTIVSPYIRMYDTKITTGNKNYLHHYIITNVFYSILSGNINLTSNDDRAINKPYDDKYYYGIDGIKSNRLKFGGMNNSILSNDNQFREYYKSRYSDLYNVKDDDEIKNIYKVFLNIFADYSTVPTTEDNIDTYFKGTVLTKDTILKIYSIIKKCFELFNEDRFNNNIVYYNNRDPSITDKSKTQITIDSYIYFSFYKNGDKLIPHQFILKLTKSQYEDFVGAAVVTAVAAVGTKPAIPARAVLQYHTDTKTGFDTALGKFNPPASTATDMTPILEDNISDEDSINQKEDIRNKNIIKIIAKYLLILGHINYNGIEYKRYDDETIKKQIFELRTRKLYQLISNVSYNDTYDGIDDTFKSINFEKAGELISIKVNTVGSGYTTPPSITIPAVSPDIAATVQTVDLKDKTIKSITLDVKGKYTTAPTITIPVGDEKGTAATATAYIGYDLLISNKKYKTLTYMYNYLETKYVSLSSNNNKNYLLNIIQSINNTLNNDDKIITATTGSKESKYLFAKRIEEMKVQPEYEDEKAILEKAIRISTTSFESTYYMNMLIIICYIIATIKSV